MERVYTIGADMPCPLTELATISPGGRWISGEIDARQRFRRSPRFAGLGWWSSGKVRRPTGSISA